MLSIVRKKKAEDEAAHNNNNHKTGSSKSPEVDKKTGFFRKNETTKTPRTPPISTPDSTERGGGKAKKERPSVKTVEVPSGSVKPKTNVAVEADGMNRVDSLLSDLSGSAAQDPPARVMRTPSAEAPAEFRSRTEGRFENNQQTYTTTENQLPVVPLHPADPPDYSLVTKVLGIVDLSCVASGLVPEANRNGRKQQQPQPPPYHHEDPIREVHSFQYNEWGVAPAEDDGTDAAAVSRSKTKRELAAVAASVDAAENPLSPVQVIPPSSCDDNNNNTKRHENVELVYKESVATKVAVVTTAAVPTGKSMGVTTWMAKKLHPNKVVVKESATRGIAARRDETTTMTGSRLAEKKAVPADSKTPESKMPAVEPFIEPIEYQKRPPTEGKKQSKPARRLRQAWTGKKNKNNSSNSSKPAVTAAIITPPKITARRKGGSPLENATTTTTTDVDHSTNVSFGNNNINQDASQQHHYKKVLKSIKGPPQALETVHEEGDEMFQHKVRVPGIENADSFISDKDLIGCEVLEEIYASIEHPVTPEHQEERQHFVKPTAIVKVVDTSGKYEEDVAGKLSISSHQEIALAATPVHRSRSWKERLGLKRSDEDAADLTEDSTSGGGNRSLPGTSTEKVKKEKKKTKKPQWKAAIDPATGRTYYFHKKTRETRWTQPPDSHVVPSKVEKKAERSQLAPATTAIVQVASNEADGQMSAQKKSPRDLDSNARMTKPEPDYSWSDVTSPPVDVSRIDKLSSQYEGRDELLAQLRNLTESQPFDEPVAPTMRHDLVQLEDEKKTADDRVSVTRTRTGASLYSGFSGRFSQKSRISELTQQIKNTSSSKAVSNTARDVASPLRDVASQAATSISTSLDGVPVTKPPRPKPKGPAKIPKHIPVPRLRELYVEEFPTTDRLHGGRGGMRRNNKPARPGPDEGSRQPIPQPTDNNYLGDSEDTDAEKSTVSYAATDSISALSEADLSYVDRKEAYHDARLRALDRAIAQEDWDLAAQLSEGMRTSSKTDPKPNRAVPREWAQSEMDRFISENDWDAVAAYIAQVRSNVIETARKAKQNLLGATGHAAGDNPNIRIRPANSIVPDPQKRFGARSQLQHDRDLSSVDSFSSHGSTYDSEYTSESYDCYSDDERPPPPNSRPRQAKEFVC